MVVPAGEPIRMQITAADVIHAFAVPSLWFKLDACPGRINEKVAFDREAGRLLRPVLGTVRRPPRLHADRVEALPRPTVRRLGDGAVGRRQMPSVKCLPQLQRLPPQLPHLAPLPARRPLPQLLPLLPQRLPPKPA